MIRSIIAVIVAGFFVQDLYAASPTPASRLKQPRKSTNLVATPFAQWPQIVMENELVLSGGKVRKFASFLTETPSGIVAVSVVPDIPGRTDDVSCIRQAQHHMTSWTMWSPTKPKQRMRVGSFESLHAANAQVGVALALTGVTGSLPVHPLKMGVDRKAPDNRTFYIVGCRWTAEHCEQAVVEGKWAGGDTSADPPYEAIFIGLQEKIDPEFIAGAAVLDGDGDVIGVGRVWPYGGGSPGYAQIVACESVKNVASP
jgi:hypothetical protein